MNPIITIQCASMQPAAAAATKTTDSSQTCWASWLPMCWLPGWSDGGRSQSELFSQATVYGWMTDRSSTTFGASAVRYLALRIINIWRDTGRTFGHPPGDREQSIHRQPAWCRVTRNRSIDSCRTHTVTVTGGPDEPWWRYVPAAAGLRHRLHCTRNWTNSTPACIRKMGDVPALWPTAVRWANRQSDNSRGTRMFGPYTSHIQLETLHEGSGAKHDKDMM